MIDPAYPALSRAVSGSLLWRAATIGVRAGSAAWQSSATARFVSALSVLRSTATLAFIAAAAGTVWVLAQSVLPEYVRSGLPLMWPIAAVLLLAGVAVAANHMDRAWRDSVVAGIFSQPHDR
jgi:hypothetical protein